MEWIPFWRSILLFIFTTFFLYFLNNIIAWIVDWWIILWKNRCILIKKNAPLKSISTYCTYRRPSGAESKKPLQFGYLSQAKKNVLTKIWEGKYVSKEQDWKGPQSSRLRNEWWNNHFIIITTCRSLPKGQ